MLAKGQICLLDVLSGSPSDPIWCVLRPTQLDNDTKYEAVSYTWGQKTTIDRTIWVNARPQRVRPNVFNLLQTLRLPDRVRTMWIDGLCINQTDTEEKSNQVRLMGQIYRSAQCVLLHLGAAADSSDRAFDFFQDVAERDDRIEGVAVCTDDAVRQAVRALCCRDYWSRAWIRQELIFAKRIKVYCGHWCINWDEFVRICDIHFRSEIIQTPAQTFLQQKGQNGEDKSLTLLDLLSRYGDAKCHDPRDRVYSLLSLASDCADGKGIQADYSLGPAALFDKVLVHCRPTDPLAFVALLAGINLPKSLFIRPLPHCVTRIMQYVKSILSNTTQQMQQGFYNIRPFENTPEEYSPILEYSAMKTRIVWHILRDSDVFEPPLSFNSIYDTPSETHRAPRAQIERADKIQDLLEDYSDMIPDGCNPFLEIYVLLEDNNVILTTQHYQRHIRARRLEQHKYTGSPTFDNIYDDEAHLFPERLILSARESFWQRLAEGWTYRKIPDARLPDLVDRLADIAGLQGWGRNDLFQEFVKHEPVHPRHLMQILAIVTPRRDCAWCAEFSCPVQRWAVFWMVVTTLVPIPWRAFECDIRRLFRGDDDDDDDDDDNDNGDQDGNDDDDDYDGDETPRLMDFVRDTTTLAEVMPAADLFAEEISHEWISRLEERFASLDSVKMGCGSQWYRVLSLWYTDFRREGWAFCHASMYSMDKLGEVMVKGKHRITPAEYESIK